jgi:hypothetical protein
MAHDHGAIFIGAQKYRMIPIDLALDMFEYEPTTGVFRHRYDGRIARQTMTPKGYANIAVGGSKYPSHRVAWCMANGRQPTGDIDHINGDRSDNRLCNLRDVTRGENGRNAKTPRTNTSGHIGVSRRGEGSWYAYIKINQKRRWLGSFASIDDAIQARVQAQADLGFHPNHGRTQGRCPPLSNAPCAAAGIETSISVHVHGEQYDALQHQCRSARATFNGRSVPS